MQSRGKAADDFMAFVSGTGIELEQWHDIASGALAERLQLVRAGGTAVGKGLAAGACAWG